MEDVQSDDSLVLSCMYNIRTRVITAPIVNNSVWKKWFIDDAGERKSGAPSLHHFFSDVKKSATN